VGEDDGRPAGIGGSELAKLLAVDLVALTGEIASLAVAPDLAAWQRRIFRHSSAKLIPLLPLVTALQRMAIGPASA
jgi:hypothetical protein